jgi:hypothetical protein
LIGVGSLGFAAGMGWLALAVEPDSSYAALVLPMLLGGAGFSVAVPAATRSAVSLVAPPDLAKASGAYSTLRQLGGAFGVAILGAVFATAGGYGSPATFVAGYVPALGVAALLALGAAVAALALPRAVLSGASTEARPAAAVGRA